MGFSNGFSKCCPATAWKFLKLGFCKLVFSVLFEVLWIYKIVLLYVLGVLQIVLKYEFVLLSIKEHAHKILLCIEV